MIQFKILSGKMAGSETGVRRFPFRMGRAASADLQIEEDGVWDEHLTVDFVAATGFMLRVHPQALATVNGGTIREAVLRNGDLIEIGALKIRFWLGATRQASLLVREWLTWAAFLLITAFQVFLIYRLVP